MATADRKRRIIIVGAGQTGRALVRMLSDSWEISVLDVDPIKLERLANESAGRPLNLLAKDGTSLMNLREAGIEGAEWLAALTNRDDVNNEACRVALSIDQPPAAIGIVRQPEAVKRLESVGAQALTRPAAIAGLLANRVQSAHQVAVNVGLGRGEILEIPVLAGSPAVDARVADLHAGRWLIAAIYRGEQILIPHGDAVIRRGDRLLLTGEPDILPQIGDYLRAGVARFPLQFGSRLVAVAEGRLGERFRSEIEYLCTHTRTKAVRIFTPKSAPGSQLSLETVRVESATYDTLPHFVARLPQELPVLDCGGVMLPKKEPSWLHKAGLARPSYFELLDALSCPLLLAAGSHPYERLLLPVTESTATLLSAELAIDLARQMDIRVTAVTVTTPSFVSGDETADEQRRAFVQVAEVASLYHLRVEHLQLEGNPVLEIRKLARPGDLLVMAHRSGRRHSFFDPDTSLHIIDRCPSSVLVLPYIGRRRGNG